MIIDVGMLASLLGVVKRAPKYGSPFQDSRFVLGEIIVRLLSIGCFWSNEG